MSAVGTSSPHFSFPYCTSFIPTLSNGRVCYKLNLDPKLQSKEGIEGGLTLMIDNNWERSVASHGFTGLRRDSSHMSFKKLACSNSAEVYIPTMAPFTGFHPGSYILKSLKKMSGTDNFLSLPDTKKKCHVHIRESCEMHHLVTNSEGKCHCLPWALQGQFQIKVKHKISHLILVFRI